MGPCGGGGGPHLGPPQPFRGTRPLVSVRCYILENDTVQCDLDLYKSLQAWKDHKLHIDHEVRGFWRGTEAPRDPRASGYFQAGGGGGDSVVKDWSLRDHASQATLATVSPHSEPGETRPRGARLVLGSLATWAGGTQDPSAATNAGRGRGHPQAVPSAPAPTPGFRASSPALCLRSKPCRTKLRTCGKSEVT